jgi:Zn-dependent peptidase ImmA (M78 family)
MALATEVPITPSVLEWAIDQSGFELDEVARAADVSITELQAWLNGNTKPGLGQMRKLATKLHRPFASFLLPSPPKTRQLAVEFRHPRDDDRDLSPVELRYLRRSSRMQEVLSWLSKELEQPPSKIPSIPLSGNPEQVADLIRGLIRIPTSEQRQWPSASTAFDEWRIAIERMGVLVFLFPLGKQSCWGYSLWDDYAPVIAVNTARNESARIFTLFHELGHLVTRTSSACIESVRFKDDPIERWCERFAACVLMPAADVGATLRKLGFRGAVSLELAKKIANTYRVSLRAAVIRLIELGAATWKLYEEIPPISDAKPPGGGGGGRDRTQIKEDQFGNRATSLFIKAVERDVLSRSQAVGILDIPDVAFDQLSQSGGTR